MATNIVIFVCEIQLVLYIHNDISVLLSADILASIGVGHCILASHFLKWFKP